MAARGHFGFIDVTNFAHISQSGMGADFATNTLKYHNKQEGCKMQQMQPLWIPFV